MSGRWRRPDGDSYEKAALSNELFASISPIQPNAEMAWGADFAKSRQKLSNSTLSVVSSASYEVADTPRILEWRQQIYINNAASNLRRFPCAARIFNLQFALASLFSIRNLSSIQEIYLIY